MHINDYVIVVNHTHQKIFYLPGSPVALYAYIKDEGKRTREFDTRLLRVGMMEMAEKGVDCPHNCSDITVEFCVV